MNETIYFGLGLLASIPIGFFVNLKTPAIQKYLEQYSKARALKRTRNLQAEYQEILNYRQNRNEFHEYLFSIVIRTTLIGSLGGILASLVFSIPSIRYFVKPFWGPFRGFVESISYLLGQLIVILIALLIINICLNALRVIAKVKNFAEYEEMVRKNSDVG